MTEVNADIEHQAPDCLDEMAENGDTPEPQDFGMDWEDFYSE